MGAVQTALVRFETVRVRDAITRPATTPTYAAGDVISEVTTNDHFTFQNCGNPGIYTGTIDAARLFSSTTETTKPDVELWLFHTDIAEVADDGVFAPTDAEMLTLIGVIDFGVASWKTGKAGTAGVGNSVCEVRNIGLPFVLLKDKDNPHIYGQLVIRNTYTAVASEVFTAELSIYKD